MSDVNGKIANKNSNISDVTAELTVSQLRSEACESCFHAVNE